MKKTGWVSAAGCAVQSAAVGQSGLAPAQIAFARLDWAPHLCTTAGVLHGGVLIHQGRTTVTAQTSVYDAAERLVAQTTQVQAVR